MTTEPTAEQTAWQHAARLATMICETDWDALLDRLPALDGYLPDQLTAAADRLRQADAAAAAALRSYRAAKATFGLLPKTQRIQLTDAEEALTTCGYLHPSRARLLGNTVLGAIADRHEARGELTDLLFCASAVIDNA